MFHFNKGLKRKFDKASIQVFNYANSTKTKFKNSLNKLKEDQSGLEFMEWVMLLGGIVLVIVLVVWALFGTIAQYIQRFQQSMFR